MRYEDVNDELVEVFLNTIEERFPQYDHLKFKLIFDTKKRIKAGKVILATIELASDKIRFFSKDNLAIEGYDYVLVVDKKAWELSSEKDKVRILSHELRHVVVDEKDKLKIRDHEINDFHAEVKLNADDPEWLRKLTTLVEDIYTQEKEEGENKKGENV